MNYQVEGLEELDFCPRARGAWCDIVPSRNLGGSSELGRWTQRHFDERRWYCMSDHGGRLCLVCGGWNSFAH